MYLEELSEFMHSHIGIPIIIRDESEDIPANDLLKLNHANCCGAVEDQFHAIIKNIHSQKAQIYSFVNLEHFYSFIDELYVWRNSLELTDAKKYLWDCIYTEECANEIFNGSAFCYLFSISSERTGDESELGFYALYYNDNLCIEKKYFSFDKLKIQVWYGKISKSITQLDPNDLIYTNKQNWELRFMSNNNPIKARNRFYLPEHDITSCSFCLEANSKIELDKVRDDLGSKDVNYLIDEFLRKGIKLK